MAYKDDDGGGGGGGTTNGADGQGLIDPDLFPLKAADIDLDGVLAAAEAFSGIGQRVTDGLETLPLNWTTLTWPGVYESPQADQVHDLMTPAVDAGERFASGATTAANALTTFRMALLFRFLPLRLSALESTAREFRDDALNGVPRPSRAIPMLNLLDIGKDDTVDWWENPEYTERNQELLARYAEILEDVSEAACEAAETIQKIPGLPTLPTPEPYDADAIAVSEMPWGSPRDPDLTFDAQIVRGVAASTKALLSSLAALAGWDGDSWSPGNALDAWGGMGNSLLGLLMLGGINRHNMMTGKNTSEQIERWLNSDDPLLRYLGRRLRDGESLVLPLVGGNSVDIEDAADRWQEKPWQVGTETALAWVLLLAPGPKVGKNVPMSPKSRAMLDQMIGKADLIQTGSGWYTKAGIRVLDSAGRRLGDIIYGGSGGKPGGSHMWRPGEDPPTPGDKPGGEHKREPQHRGGPRSRVPTG